jgi:hypothetical protein
MKVFNVRAAGALLLVAGITAACGGNGDKVAVTSTPATAAAAATTAASGYTAEANAVLGALATSASEVAGVMGKPDPSSAAWRASLNTGLDALTKVDAQARALKPGPGDAATQQALLDITADFARAAQLLRTSIDPVNVDGLDQAAQILTASVTEVASFRASLPQS